MLQALVGKASRYLNDLNRTLSRNRLPPIDGEAHVSAAPAKQNYKPLTRIVLTDEVNRTILDEFAAHRQSKRGNEETGWLLLGVRDEHEALALATLPAGADRDAGVAHVLFNSTAQAVACRILRQWDRRLIMFGVVHTHPGSLRHPSDGDYRGDIQWVGNVRGGEGVFGIGTADVRYDKSRSHGAVVASRPTKNQQVMGELCLSWYALGENDRDYKPLELGLTIGPDLARPLRPLWSAIEENAEALERLFLQLKGMRFHFVAGQHATLMADIPLADAKDSLRLLLNDHGVEYYVVRGDEVIAVDPETPRIDQGVFQILAELAGCDG